MSVFGKESPFYGSIVVIKRSGADGSVFSLVEEECILGREDDCDIRIQLPEVSGRHAWIKVDPLSKRVSLTCVGSHGLNVNGSFLSSGESKSLNDSDLLQISDRFFRFEYPDSTLRKRVSFGPAISPEYIDKSLPPSTPVKKGAYPDYATATGTPLLNQRRTKHDTIYECSPPPVGVLVRHANDTPRVKASSGCRSSPRSEGKSPIAKTPKKRSLTKAPAQFYGASAAKTPRGAKKPLPKTPRTVGRPKKTSLTKATAQFYGVSPAKTPRGAKKPLPKTPKTVGKTPRKVSSKVVKSAVKAPAKKSWADMLKTNLGKTPKVTKLAREAQLEKEKQRARLALLKKPKKGGTGMARKVLEKELLKDRHAQSPEDIVIRKTKEPLIASKASNTKQRSSPLKKLTAKRLSPSPTKTAAKSNLRGRSKSLATIKKNSPHKKSGRSLSPRNSRILEEVKPKRRFTLAYPSPSNEKSPKTTPAKKAQTPSTGKRGRPTKAESSAKLGSSSARKMRKSSLSPSKTPTTRLNRSSSTGSIKSRNASPSKQVETPSTVKRGRPPKSASSDKLGSSSAKKIRKSSLSPSKTPTTRLNRSSSTGSIKSRNASPTKEVKTPSTARRGRPTKSESFAKLGSAKSLRKLSVSPSKTPKARLNRSSSIGSIKNRNTSPSKEVETPSTGKRGRPPKSASSDKLGSSAKKMRKASLSPSKTPTTRLNRSSSTGSIRSRNASPTKDVKTPSTARRGRPRKSVSSAKLELSSSKKTRNSSSSPSKTPKNRLNRSLSTGSIKSPTNEVETPSTGKRGRPTKAQSYAKHGLSSAKKIRKSSLSPSKTPITRLDRSSSTGSIRSLNASHTKDAKTPSTGKRGRPTKVESSAKLELSSVKKTRNASSSPSKTPKTRLNRSSSTGSIKSLNASHTKDAKTPSTGKRGRPTKAESSAKLELSSVKKTRNASSPSKTPKTRLNRSLSTGSIKSRNASPTKEVKTPSTARRGRPTKSESSAKLGSAKSLRKLSVSPSKTNITRVNRSSSSGSIKSRNPSPTKEVRTPSTARRGRPTLSSVKRDSSSEKKVAEGKGSKLRYSLFVEEDSSSNGNSKSSTPRRFPSKESPRISSVMDSSLDAGIMFSSSKTPANSPSNGRIPLTVGRSLSKSLRESLGGLQDSTFFDFDSVQTPIIPLQVLVSPLLTDAGSLRSKPAQRMSLGASYMKKFGDAPQRKRHSIGRIDVHGRRSAHSTPGKRNNSAQRSTRNVQKSPRSSYDNLVGVKELLKTPKKFLENFQEGDLEALFASPEYKVLSPEKRNRFLKKLELATQQQSLSRKRSLGTLGAKPSNVLKRMSLEPNINLNGSDNIRMANKTRTSTDNDENMSPTRSRKSFPEKDVEAKTKLGRSKKDSPTKPKAHEKMKSPLLILSDVYPLLKESSNTIEKSDSIASENQVTGRRTRGNPSSKVEKEATAKRSTRSKAATKKETAVSTPKRATRGRNKSENDENPEPTPKQSTRGRKKVASDDDSEEPKGQKSSESVSPVRKATRGRKKVEKVTSASGDDSETAKQLNRSVQTHSSDSDDPTDVVVAADKKPKAGRPSRRKPKANAKSESPPPKRTTRKVSSEKKQDVLKTTRRGRSKEEEVVVEASPKVLPKTTRRGRSTEEEVVVEASPKVVPTKTTTRRGRSKDEDVVVEASPKAVIKTTRRGRPKAAAVEEEAVVEASPAKSPKVVPPKATRRGRTKATPVEEEVVVEASPAKSPKVIPPKATRRGRTKATPVEEEVVVEASPKPRRTRRAANKSPAPSALSKDSAQNESPPASSARKGRRRKEPSVSSKSPLATEEKGRRKRNREEVPEEDKTTESSPPKRGRRAKNQLTTADKAVSPVKRVTRSRAKK